MKKIARYFQLLMAALLLASCNLFIDDKVGSDHGDVPEHTGNEYDNVVKMEEDGCTVNYQLKRDVRHLGERDMQYIRYVAHDEVGALIEIHYDANTPEDLLPVPGEVLLSGANDKFEWGCSHRMQSRVLENGVYRYVGSICNVKEVYETLELDGQLTTTETEEYYVVPEPDEGDEGSQVRQVRTRAGGAGGNDIDVSLQSDGFTFNIPLGLELDTDYGNFGVNLEMPAETNFTKIQLQAVFSDFTLSNPEFQLIQTIEEQNNMTFKGSCSAEKGFKKKNLRWHPIKGKAFTIGPLVIVFFVDIELHPTIGFEATAQLTRHQKVVTTYTVNLFEGTCRQEEKKLIDEPWKVVGEVTLTLGLEFDLSIGFGFYGKVFSVRFVPYINFTAEAKWPGMTQGAYDASAKNGIEAKVELGGRIRFVVDFTFNELFGGSITLEETKANLALAAELYDKNSDFYKQMKNYSETEDYNNNENNEWGVNIPLIKKEIWNWKVTWYPVISDESFAISKYWESNGKVGLHSQYKVNNLGLFASIATSTYCPALRIMEGSTERSVVFPEEGGKQARLEQGATYHFTLPDLPANKKYTAHPCYYQSVFGISTVVAVDKGLPFYTITPSVTMSEVKPTDFIVDDEEKYAKKNGKYFLYVFEVETKVEVEGSKNIAAWGLYDKVSSFSSNGRGKDKKHGDGTYTAIWYFIDRTNIPTTLQTLQHHIEIIPRYRLESDDDYETEREGSHYEIMVYSNGKYDIIDDGSGLSMKGLTYEIKGKAPVRRHVKLPSVIPNDDVETEVVLGKIIAPNGEVIYQHDI